MLHPDGASHIGHLPRHRPPNIARRPRAAYDRFGHAAFEQGGGFRGGFHDPFDIFREVFSGAGGVGGGIFETFFGGMAGQGEDRQRGADLRYDMQITLEEAAFGAEKEIEACELRIVLRFMKLWAATLELGLCCDVELRL